MTDINLLAFEVAGHRHGVLLTDVVEVLRAVAIETLPGGPSAIEGVIDLRGQVVPVLDTRARFRLPQKPVAPSDQLIVVRAGEHDAVLRVDRTIGLVSVDAARFNAAVASETALISAVAKLPDGLLCIYDLGSFLSESEAAAFDKIVHHEASS